MAMFCAMIASIVFKMMNMRMNLDARFVIANYQITKQVNLGISVMTTIGKNREKAVLIGG